MHHLIAQILLREDHGALLREEGVRAGVVGMNVRVHEDLERPVGERPNRLQRFVGDLPVLGVHHQHAVGAEEHHRSAAGRIGMCGVEAFRSMEHEKIRRHLRRHQDLDPVPRRLIARRKRERTFARRDDRDRISRLLRRDR